MVEVHQFKESFLNSFENADKYAVMNAKTFRDDVGYQKSNVSKSVKLEGLLKITNPCNKRKIYRKYRYDKECKDGQILLSLSARSELGFHDVFSKDNKLHVCVKQACWFAYYWCNSDSYIRHPFRLAVIAMICTVISITCQIMQFFIDFCK